MIETGWATGAYRDTEVMEIAGRSGSIYLGDPGVDSHHLILSSNEFHTLTFPAFVPTHFSRIS